MKRLNDKTIAKKNYSKTKRLPKLQSGSESTFLNNNTTKASQLQGDLEEETLQGKPEHIKKKENETHLPDNLKLGIENLSGFSLNDVKVHYNSNKPAQINVFTDAQGTNIHIAPGREKHLPHEAWHVVQQKQGRVKPTIK